LFEEPLAVHLPKHWAAGVPGIVRSLASVAVALVELAGRVGDETLDGNGQCCPAGGILEYAYELSAGPIVTIRGPIYALPGNHD
jgi:hypothetical protein